MIAKFYCYIYRDPSRNNEPFYVGKGTGKRAYSHLSRTDHHPLTFRLRKIANENVQPDIEIISALDEDHALFLEEVLIEMFGRKDLGLGPLLNLTNGGDGFKGFKHKPETIKRIADSNRGKPRSAETKRKISASNTGRTHTAETRLKLSEQRKGKPGYQWTDALKAQVSATKTGKPRKQVQCPHCMKTGGEGIMQRWHFANCKSAPVVYNDGTTTFVVTELTKFVKDNKDAILTLSK